MVKDIIGVVHTSSKYTLEGGIAVAGSWTASTATPNYYGANYLHDQNSGKGNKNVRFTPYLLNGDNYEVFIRWTADPNRASNVPVDVISAGGTQTVTVNQRINGGAWNSLGTYSFNAGMEGGVRIRNAGTNGYVIADAVKFVNQQTQQEIIMDNADYAEGSTTDSLNDGISRITTLGSSAVKLWLSRNIQNAYLDFFWNDADAAKRHPWPTQTNPQGGFNIPLEVAQLPYYQAALQNPSVKTYVLEVFLFTNAGNPAPVNWLNGLTVTQKSAAYNQMLDLAKHLLQTYANTGKTFILSNWEGDNDVKAIRDSGLTPAQRNVALDTMREYIQQRQNAVHDARIWAAAQGYSGVNAYNALEVNELPTGPDYVSEYPLLIDAVVPNVQCDLYSYSCWQSMYPNTSPQILYQINYMRSKTPANGILGRDNIYIGEYGSYEHMFFPETYQPEQNKLHHSEGGPTSSDSKFALVISQQTDYLLRTNVRHLFFWTLYGTGFRTDNAAPTFPTIPSSYYSEPYNVTEEYLSGTWLIRPPGHPGGVENYQGLVDTPSASNTFTFTGAYQYLQSRMDEAVFYDELSGTSNLASHTPNLAIATGTQAWAERDYSRIYPTTSSAENIVYYVTRNPQSPSSAEGICNWNIKVFLFTSSTSPSAIGKLKGYLSADGVTWSPSFDFVESDLAQPDPVGASLWYRLYLRPPAAFPAGFTTGQKYLRIEWASQHELGVYDTQIGSVQIFTKP